MPTVKTKCPHCEKETELDITDKEFDNYYVKKMHIQYAMPERDVSFREMLLTGICDTCWKLIFKEDES